MIDTRRRLRALSSALPWVVLTMFVLTMFALTLFTVSACRGPRKEIRLPEPKFIAVHRDIREAFSAYRARDPRRLDLAYGHLAEMNDLPGVAPQGEPTRAMSLSPGGRYLVVTLGATMGGSKVLLFEAASGRLLLGVNGYATSVSPDDRWLACLQHRYATSEPGADVGSYEALLLVDLGRVRGAASDDPTVFHTLVSDTEGRIVNARPEFTGNDRIRLVRAKPPLKEEYTLEGEPVNKKEKKGRRWYWLWLH